MHVTWYKYNQKTPEQRQNALRFISNFLLFNLAIAVILLHAFVVVRLFVFVSFDTCNSFFWLLINY